MDATEDDVLWEEDDNIPHQWEHDIISGEDPYDDHLNGEEWDFVFD